MFFVIGPLWFVVMAWIIWFLCQPRAPKVYRIIRPRRYNRSRINHGQKYTSNGR